MKLMKHLDVNYYITRNRRYKIIYYCLIIGVTLFAIGKNLREATGIFSSVEAGPKGFDFYFKSPPKDPFKDVPRVTLFFVKAKMLENPRYRPWPLDTQCSRFEVGLPLETRKTFLLSYPSSESSWLRYLLEGAVGFYAGSPNQDFVHSDLSEEQSINGMKTGWEHDNVFLVMAHSEQELPHKFAKTILLLSCPGSAILSNWHTSKKNNDKSPVNKEVKETNFETYKFRSFVKRQIKYWQQLHTYALTNLTRILPIFYNDLSKDFVSELHRGLEYLKMFPNEERINCLYKYPNRPSMENLNHAKNPFNKEEQALMRQAVIEVNKLLPSHNVHSLDQCEFL